MAMETIGHCDQRPGQYATMARAKVEAERASRETSRQHRAVETVCYRALRPYKCFTVCLVIGR